MDSLPLPAARVPARTVLASIVAVWLCYFVLATARGWLVGLELHNALLWRRALVILASIGVTAALWPLLRLLDARRVWQQSVAVMLIALPASLLLAQINQWAFADIENQVTQKIGEREGIRIRRDEAGNLLVDPLSQANATPAPVDDLPPPVAQPTPAMPTIAQQEQDAALKIDRATGDDTRWLQLTDVALGRYFLLLAWAALYFALVKAEQARMAERREGEYRRAAKAAELRSLRYQVNPHFLFNTLNSLSALVITDKPQAAETMIQTLSTYYRRSLAEDPTGDVSLGQEIEQQQLYLELEAVRFPERLVTRFDIPEALEQVSVPGMILQPLVENSVKYAVAPTSRSVTIALSAREEYGRLVLTVCDDGPGARDTSTSGFGIGIANVRERLAARFGAAASVASGPDETGGWRTVIRLPLKADHA
jgi:signal transduction histidine kinase